MVAAPRLAFNKRQVKAIVFVQSLNLRHVRVRQTRPVAPKSEIFTNVLGSPHPGHDSNFPLDLKESRFCVGTLKLTFCFSPMSYLPLENDLGDRFSVFFAESN